MTNGPGWCRIIYCLKYLTQSLYVYMEQDRLQGHKKVIAELYEYLFKVFMVTELYNVCWLAVALDMPGPALQVVNTETAPNFMTGYHYGVDRYCCFVY